MKASAGQVPDPECASNNCHCTGFAESSPGTTHVAQGAVLSVNKCHQGALREVGGDPRDTVMEEKGSVL